MHTGSTCRTQNTGQRSSQLHTTAACRQLRAGGLPLPHLRLENCSGRYPSSQESTTRPVRQPSAHSWVGKVWAGKAHWSINTSWRRPVAAMRLAGGAMTASVHARRVRWGHSQALAGRLRLHSSRARRGSCSSPAQRSGWLGRCPSAAGRRTGSGAAGV